MITKIMSGNAPSLFYLTYDHSYKVNNVIAITGHFIVPEIILKRQDISSAGRRANWEGCFINLARVPEKGRVEMFKNGKPANQRDVIKRFRRTEFFKGLMPNNRGWLMDVFRKVEKTGKKEFALRDIYSGEKEWRRKCPNNNNPKAKIRQQLQILRDSGYLTFLGDGKYRLLD